MTEPYRTVYRAEQCSPLYAHTVQNSKIYGTVQNSSVQYKPVYHSMLRHICYIHMMTVILNLGSVVGVIPISVLRLWLPSGWNWGARYQLSSLRLIYRFSHSNFELIFSTERFLFAQQVPWPALMGMTSFTNTTVDTFITLKQN